MTWLIKKWLFVSVYLFNCFIGKIDCKNAINLTEHDFGTFKAFLFNEMETHAHLCKDFDISNDNSILLFVFSGSLDSLKDEKLIWLGSVFDELLSTNYC